MAVVAEKRQIRKTIQELKKRLSADDKNRQSQAIFYKLEKMEEFQKALQIALYWSLADEVATHSFIEKWYQHKEIYLPVIVGENLEFRKFEGKHAMIKDDKFEVLQPIGNEISVDSLAMIIVPGVGFDENNNRLGRGGGFYDRILPNMVNALKIGVAFNIQKVLQVPVSHLDAKMDHVIFGA